MNKTIIFAGRGKAGQTIENTRKMQEGKGHVKE
jgi:hypothetical protein